MKKIVRRALAGLWLRSSSATWCLACQPNLAENTFFLVSSRKLGKWSNLTSFCFYMGWNHQLVMLFFGPFSFVICENLEVFPVIRNLRSSYFNTWQQGWVLFKQSAGSSADCWNNNILLKKPLQKQWSLWWSQNMNIYKSHTAWDLGPRKPVGNVILLNVLFNHYTELYPTT